MIRNALQRQARRAANIATAINSRSMMARMGSKAAERAIPATLQNDREKASEAGKKGGQH